MNNQKCLYTANAVFEICTASAESLQFLRVLKDDRINGEVVFFDLTAYECALIRNRDQHRLSAAHRAEKRRALERKDSNMIADKLQVAAPAISADDTARERSRASFLIRKTYEELDNIKAEARIFQSDFRSAFSPPRDHEVVDDPSLSEDERKRRAHARSQRDGAWAVIEPLVKGEALGLLLVRGVTGSMIAKRAAEMRAAGTSCTLNKVYAYLYKYFAFGMTPNALLAGDHRKGNANEPRRYAPGIRAGRKSKRNPHLPPGIEQPQRRGTSELDLLRFRISFKTVKRNGDSPRMAYNKMLVEKYKVATFVKDARGDERFKLNPGVSEYDFPSYEIYQYYYHKETDPVVKAQLASSTGDFARNKQRRGGDPKSRIFGLGDEYQIDSTPSLCGLRSDLDPSRILGPATCYNIVEVRTTVIVAQYFTWLPPSWETFRQALYVAFTSPAKYYRRFDVEVDEAAFPAIAIICQCVRADRQESMALLSAETLTKGMQVDISNPAPARPNLNCFTERYHKLINEYAGIGGVPGSPPAGGVDKGESDPIYRAIMTRKEFAKLCILAAEHHNKFAVLETGVPARALAENLRPHPMHLFNWLLENSSSTPRTLSEEEVRMKLLPQAMGRVTARGIEFSPVKGAMKRLYTCETAMKESWFTRANVSKSWQLRVWYHFDYSKHIWIERKNGTLEQCNLISDHDYGSYGFDELGQALQAVYTATPSESQAEMESALNIAGTNAKFQKAGKERAKQLDSSTANMPKSVLRQLRTADMAEERVAERQSLVNEFARAVEDATPAARSESPTTVEVPTSRRTQMIRDRMSRLRQDH